MTERTSVFLYISHPKNKNRNSTSVNMKRFSCKGRYNSKDIVLYKENPD